ncbi:MAG: hypothetical protein CVV64_01135 [Candidatus Wallbacteria bacterium HGW-Wallbacteria-1]|uniref:Uncharacterized protein n=1 Tax=Candidatus Wallbacteria bacterium HGW-Wallbacteria-1 TaxID=2013854 RepID=A0A2N1PUM8_9BACT|nr:MAG: hypothetical protein CVV64_01135 [Candidatus Wallbacteria bacterium HGW-Wallbacteria-1]
MDFISAILSERKENGRENKSRPAGIILISPESKHDRFRVSPEILNHENPPMIPLQKTPVFHRNSQHLLPFIILAIMLFPGTAMAQTSADELTQEKTVNQTIEGKLAKTLCCNASSLPEEEVNMVKKWAQNLFDLIPAMPLIPFPDSENEILKRLSRSIRQNYFTRSMVSSVSAEATEKPYFYRRLEIDFHNFLFRGIKPLSSRIELFDATIRPYLALSRPQRALKAARAVHRLELEPISLSQFISSEATRYGLSMPSFTLDGKGRAKVSGKLRILWCDMNIEALIRLGVNNGEIEFYIDRMAVSGIPLPRFVLGKMLRTFNPVMRVVPELMPFNLRPVSVTMDATKITILSRSPDQKK